MRQALEDDRLIAFDTGLIFADPTAAGCSEGEIARSLLPPKSPLAVD
jgi:hypothetical protein